MNNIEIKTMTELLFSQYQKLLLTTQEVASVTDRSVISLERDRYKAQGIPFTKLGNGGSSKAQYNITDIAKYLVSRRIQTV